jgi:hypothetical protein
MASFSAELEVAGQTYPVRWCRFGFEQATHERGRVRGKVRHGLLHLTLDVPEGDQLLTWASTPHKALAGHVTFFETNRPTARETVGFATGYCVGYDETFAAGDGTSGAYVCRLVISADKLELTPGGPSRPLGQAAVRDYATTENSLASAATNALTVGPITAATGAVATLLPPHLLAPVPSPSPDYQQVHLSAAEWQALTAGRWDLKNNKPLTKQLRNSEFHVADEQLSYRVDAKGKVVAVYDALKSYNVTGTRKGLLRIPLTLNGQPTFAGTPYMYPPGPPHQPVVSIEMAGNRPSDFRLANEAAGLLGVVKAQGRDSTDAPEGYTWHHRDDFMPNASPPPVGTCTMELVSTDAHEATFVHKGSCDQYNKHLGRKQYK